MIDLKKYGFNRKWLSDKSSHWYEKRIKNPFLKKATVIVCSGKIMVDCYDSDSGYFVTVYEVKESEKNLIKVLNWLNNG